MLGSKNKKMKIVARKKRKERSEKQRIANSVLPKLPGLLPV
jgi:hypothetical protein